MSGKEKSSLSFGYEPEDGDHVRSVIGHLFERAHFDAKALKELLLPAGRCASGEDVGGCDLVKQELLRDGLALRDGLIPAPCRAGAAVGKADNVVAGEDEVAVVCGGKEGLKGGAADVIDVLESFLVAETSNVSYSPVMYSLSSPPVSEIQNDLEAVTCCMSRRKFGDISNCGSGSRRRKGRVAEVTVGGLGQEKTDNRLLVRVQRLDKVPASRGFAGCWGTSASTANKGQSKMADGRW
ncbi:hypothetical protein EDB84DRAFT_1441718 [Lactarius hengduanensis]|nr:hypothetical protein EDB84DRAFT_1441718 [Lactarius hengduanensis]